MKQQSLFVILSGSMVHMNLECGMIVIFRNSLLFHLDAGERVKADDGYAVAAPIFVKYPKSMGSDGEKTADMQAFVRSRHETMNKSSNG
jgi:hypothetical protein